MPGSPRVKSAPSHRIRDARSPSQSYRALGTRSPSLASHEEVEKEYTFVRAIVDAMATKTLQSSPVSTMSKSAPLISPAWPSMYVRQPFGSNATQASSPLPFQRYFKPVPEVPTPVLTSVAKSSVGIENIRKNENEYEKIQHRTSLKPFSSSYPYKPRKVLFNSPSVMSDKTMVVPLHSPSQLHLQLTGDVKQIFHLERPSTSHPSPRSRPKTFPSRRSHANRASASMDQLSDKHSVATTVTQSPQESAISKEVTQYRFRIRSARKQRMKSPRPATSPEGKSCFGISFPKNTPTSHQDVQKLKTVKQFTGREQCLHDRNNMKQVINSTKVSSETQQGIDQLDREGVAEINQSDRKDFSHNAPESSNQTVSGHTMLTKTSKSLSLSVFLPREISTVERSCGRATVGSSSDKHKSQESIASVADNGGDLEVCQDGRTSCESSNPPTPLMANTTEEDQESLDELAQDEGVKPKQSETDLRRSIHCELFGPELCGDCKRHDEQQDVKNWQQMVYPGIVPDPKVLVAAPMLRRQQTKVGLDTGVNRPASHIIISKPTFGIGKPPSVCTTLDPMAVQSSQSWRFTGPGSHLSRTLKSVVTQDEIRSRIWASSASPRTRRQYMPLVS